MKKAKLLMPLSAVAALTAGIPAITLTSCNKGSTQSTKPTLEEWNTAFEALNNRPEGLCWHESDESYFYIGDQKSYAESDAAFKFSNIECGQTYSKIKSTYKYNGAEESYDSYSSMNLGALDLNITLDDETGDISWSSATTTPDFQKYILGFINMYQPYYENYTYNETDKIFEFKGDVGSLKSVDLKIKLNDNKLIEYIESTATYNSYYLGINFHFTYDTTEITVPTKVEQEFTRNHKFMTQSTYKFDADTYTEGGVERGIILDIKRGVQYSVATAAWNESGTVPNIWGDAEIYKNGILLEKEVDYTLQYPNLNILEFTTPIKTSDTIQIGINLGSSISYVGGDNQQITITLS